MLKGADVGLLVVRCDCFRTGCREGSARRRSNRLLPMGRPQPAEWAASKVRMRGSDVLRPTPMVARGGAHAKRLGLGLDDDAPAGLTDARQHHGAAATSIAFRAAMDRHSAGDGAAGSSDFTKYFDRAAVEVLAPLRATARSSQRWPFTATSCASLSLTRPPRCSRSWLPRESRPRAAPVAPHLELARMALARHARRCRSVRPLVVVPRCCAMVSPTFCASGTAMDLTRRCNAAAGVEPIDWKSAIALLGRDRPAGRTRPTSLRDAPILPPNRTLPPMSSPPGGAQGPADRSGKFLALRAWLMSATSSNARLVRRRRAHALVPGAH